MSVTEKIEEKFGLKIEKLNALEKETYFKMLEAVQKSQIDPQKFRDYVTSMKEAVERELVHEPETRFIFFPNRKQIFLKARLHNYLLLESFLISPKKAEEQLEEMVNGITK